MGNVKSIFAFNILINGHIRELKSRPNIMNLYDSYLQVYD